MSKQNERHVPVLLQDAIELLNVRAGSVIADCTLGLAGHAAEIIRRLGPNGKLIGFDRDPEALELAKGRLNDVAAELGNQAPQLNFIGEAFSSISRHVEPGSLDGILADFGVSSLQLDEARRGFSFMADGPLDMRQDTRSGLTAEQVVNEASERELADLIYEYGDERRSRRIARAICRSRPIRNTAHLAEVISAAARPMNQAERRIHPATRTFQALRILVNRELDDLGELLRTAPQILRRGGRLVVISFHSLEDRMVKDAMRDGVHDGVYRVLTKKPVTAEKEEIERNPRSRSAKLRAAVRV